MRGNNGHSKQQCVATTMQDLNFNFALEEKNQKNILNELDLNEETCIDNLSEKQNIYLNAKLLMRESMRSGINEDEIFSNIKNIEFLEDVNSSGNNNKWNEKKFKSNILADSYKRISKQQLLAKQISDTEDEKEKYNKSINSMNSKSRRVSDCSDFLLFKVTDNGLKLFTTNSCHVRLCPICSWRRQLKIFSQVSFTMNKAIEKNEYKFLFLTLTCKNVKGDKLCQQLDILFHSYYKLCKLKRFKTSVKGWFRALEITYNKKTDEYHPHFHVILMVNRSYFNKDYIKQKEFIAMWKQCMKVDYEPVVDIKVFKTDINNLTKATSEAAKYSVKESDYLFEIERINGISTNDELENGEYINYFDAVKIKYDIDLTDKVVFNLDKALAYRRLIAFGGELKKIHKALNLDDPINGDLDKLTAPAEEIREDVKEVIKVFKWSIGYTNYFLSKSFQVSQDFLKGLDPLGYKKI